MQKKNASGNNSFVVLINDQVTEKPLVVDETFELNQTNKVRKMIEIYKF